LPEKAEILADRITDMANIYKPLGWTKEMIAQELKQSKKRHKIQMDRYANWSL